MKYSVSLFIFFVALLSSLSFAQNKDIYQGAIDKDWTRVSAKRVGDQMFYVGTSVDTSSESLAIQAAEQDAVTQMIKHYFGVRLNYSLQTVESLTEIHLTLEKSEQSETLNIQGLVRQNSKIVETQKGHFSAWVQISAPISALKAEKNRLAAERREAAAQAAEEAERRRVEREERRREEIQEAAAKKERDRKQKGMVPLIYFGMTRQTFIASYPAPESVHRLGNIEVFSYPSTWSFCSNRYLSCTLWFTDGKLTSWEYVNHKFIDGSR